MSFWYEPEHIRPYNFESIRRLAIQNDFIIEKVHKHHLRVNPLKFMVDLLLSDINCGLTIILKKEEGYWDKWLEKYKRNPRINNEQHKKSVAK